MQTSCFLASSSADKPFSRWAGDKGASFVFSVYGPEDIPAYPHAVYIVVQNLHGVVVPLFVATTSALPALLFHGDRYNAALRRGGNEVHVHVPAPGSCADAVARKLLVVLGAYPILTENPRQQVLPGTRAGPVRSTEIAVNGKI